MDTVRAFFTKSGHFFSIFIIGQGSSPPLPPLVPCLLYCTNYTTLYYITLLYYTILRYLLYKPTYSTIITLFHQNRKCNRNNKIFHLISHMALLQAAPLIGTTKPQSSVPESSDRYAQLLTEGNFEIILTLEKIFLRALCTIISLIVHKKNITQTDDHQFPCELFQSCSYDTFAFEMGFSLGPLCHTKRHDKYVFTTHPPHKELFI